MKCSTMVKHTFCVRFDSMFIKILNFYKQTQKLKMF